MKFTRVCGSIFFIILSLAGCDSSVEVGGRPLDSRPASSVETDVFNDVVATQRSAPEPMATGTANLLTNPGFENGVGGWNNCGVGPLKVSTDASEGVQALQIEPDNCVYRSVQVDPGATYFLSCDVKLDPANAWTGMGLVFANNDYESLLDAPVATATSGEYMTLVSSGTAPAGTSFVTMWIHSDFGALVDNCSLVLETDRPEVITDSGNLLDNSNFSSLDAKGDLESWTSGCGGETVTSDPSVTNGTSEPNLTNDTQVTLTNGACVDQSLNTVAIASIENSFTRFGCYISGAEGYSDMSIYLDGNLAASHQIQHTQNNTFVSVDLDVTSASNGFVTLYSEGTLTAENCTFDTAGSTTPDNPSAGSIPVEFESTTLEQLVKDRLSIADGLVTRDDMLMLTSLSSSDNNAELDSLVGLEYATNLEEIDFFAPSIKSLEPLAGLTSLEFLFFFDAAIESVAPLAQLNSLNWFIAGTSPELSDISVFANNDFPNLNYLGFMNNSSVSDLTPLSGLPLRSLTLESSKVTDLSPIASIAGLFDLVLTGIQLPDVQPLIDGSIFTSEPSSNLTVSPEFVDLSIGSPDRLKLDELYQKKGEGFQITSQALSGDQTVLPAPEFTDDGSIAVEFESAVLEEMVKRRLNIREGPVTREKLLGLRSLSNGRADDTVDSLVGLEFATNLTSLSFFNSTIDSLDVLAGLTSLETISFPQAVIKSIEPLAELKSLKYIELPNAAIESLAPLAGLASLEFIELSTAAELSDISVFADLAFPELYYLKFLGSSSISDLTPLNEYDLIHLTVQNAKVTDLSPIASHVRLTELELTGSKLTNIPLLTNGSTFFTKPPIFRPMLIISSEFLDLSIGSPDRLELDELYENKRLGFEILLASSSGELSLLPVPEGAILTQEGITVEFESDALEEVVKAELSITGRPVNREDMLLLTRITNNYVGADVTSLEGLDYAHNLTSIQTTDWPIESLAPLQWLTSLKSIVMTNSPIRSLNPLSQLPELEQLIITGSTISSLGALANVTSLKILDLSGSSIDSLLPLAGHTSLRLLKLSDAPIDSIAPLVGLTGLEHLLLDNASLDSLTDLAGLTALNTLSLPKTTVDSLEPLSGHTSLADLTISTVPEFSDLSLFANQAFPRLFRLQLLGSSSISDLTPLMGYELDILTITNGKVTDPSPIASMQYLFRLELTGSKLSNLEWLADGLVFTESGSSEFGPHLIVSSTGLDLTENSADRLALENIEAKKQSEFNVMLRAPNGDLSLLDGSELDPRYCGFRSCD